MTTPTPTVADALRWRDERDALRLHLDEAERRLADLTVARHGAAVAHALAGAR